jgi:hypothetical protein
LLVWAAVISATTPDDMTDSQKDASLAPATSNGLDQDPNTSITLAANSSYAAVLAEQCFPADCDQD